jgi:hypothetical protein
VRVKGAERDGEKEGERERGGAREKEKRKAISWKNR